MSRLRPLLAAAAGVLAGLVVSAARADEAYLCADGRVVYVALGTLEAMKRTDACVAAYYGLAVEAATPASGAGSAAPAVRSSPRNEAAPTPPVLRPLDDSDTPRRAPRPGREAAARLAPVAAPDTDYRRVKVINAAAGDGAWFHHAR